MNQVAKIQAKVNITTTSNSLFEPVHKTLLLLKWIEYAEQEADWGMEEIVNDSALNYAVAYQQFSSIQLRSTHFMA